MKLIVDIKENKAEFFMELMKKFDLIDQTSDVLPESMPAKRHASRLKSLLLSGPIMTEDQVTEYNNLRSRFNQWRQK